jgi:hypothetical protein
MNIFGAFLEEQGYVNTVADVDETAWQTLSAEVVKAMSKKNTAKKGSKLKDPNKPKKNKSAYLYFCTTNRAVVKEELGEDVKATDVTRELGVRWKALKESKKAEDKKALKGFEDQAAEDKQRYIKEMDDYVVPSDDDLEAIAAEKKYKKTGKKSKKDNNAPKRGKSAYIFFCAAKRTEVKEELGEKAKNTEITARLGELWNELKTDDDRVEEMKVYTDQAAEDKVRYETEMENYVPSDNDENKVPVAKKGKDKKPAPEPEDDDDELVEEESKKSPSKKSPSKKATGKKATVKKMTGYTYFCNKHRADVKAGNPGKKAKEITKTLAEMWRTLDKAEQQEWKDSANTQK